MSIFLLTGQMMKHRDMLALRELREEIEAMLRDIDADEGAAWPELAAALRDAAAAIRTQQLAIARTMKLDPPQP